MSVRRGETVVVLLGREQVKVVVRDVYPDMAIGGDAFTAAVPDGTAPGLDHLGHFTEDQVVGRS